MHRGGPGKQFPKEKTRNQYSANGFQTAANFGSRGFVAGVLFWQENPERWERQTKTPLPDHREEEACGARSYLSRPDRVGVSTSISLRGNRLLWLQMAQIPSATLDKIPTKLSKIDCRGA